MTLAVTGRLQAAFGINPFDDTSLDDDNNWVDLTILDESEVRRVEYQTDARSDRFDVFVAGWLEATLNNQHRRYDPSNTVGPFYGELKRGVPVRVVGIDGGTAHVRWYGMAREWAPSYAGALRDSVCTLRAVTPTGALAQYDLEPLSTPSYAGDTVGGRIGRVLDDWGWPSSYRDLDDGTTLGPTQWGGSGLAHCQVAAMSDGGFFYAASDGTLTFDGPTALTTTRQTTSQVTVSHDTEPVWLADTLQVAGVGLSYRNLVRIAGTTGNIQTVDNTTTGEAPVVFQRTDLFMQSDHKAAALAEFYGDLYGTETVHPRQVRVRIDALGHVSEALALRDQAVVRLGY